MHNLRRHGLPPVPELEKQAMIERLITAITTTVEPWRIYLFGSVTSPLFDAVSDIDVLIVFPDQCSADEGRRTLHRQRPRIDRALDMICVDRATFEEKSTMGGVCFVAAREGRLVFERPPQA